MRPESTPPARIRLGVFRHASILLVLGIALTACLGDGADSIQATLSEEPARVGEFPDWIEKVYPPPDSETSATRAVQLNHSVVTAERQVRLIIDDTDVTTYAVETSPGLLEYDVDQEQSPVDLEPGSHTARAELLQVTPGAGEGVDSYDASVHDVIDTYTWTFTVL